MFVAPRSILARRTAPYFKWHANGRRSVEGHYEEDRLVGLNVMWHENGQKAEECSYKDGKLEGSFTTWDENGKVTSKTGYKNGVEVK